MKQQLISMLLILMASSSFGQFAIINDPDGYTNLREEASSSSEIVGRMYEGEPFYYGLYGMKSEDEPLADWMMIEYYTPTTALSQTRLATLSKEEKEEEYFGVYGYMHKSRIKVIEKQSPLKKHVITDELVIFSDGECSFLVQLGAFDTTAHTYEKSGPYLVLKIDGKEFWGTESSMPDREFKQIKAVVGDKVMQFPPRLYQYMYQPNLEYLKMFSDPEGHYFLVFYGGGGNAVAGYEACIAFDKEKITGVTIWKP